MIPLVVAAAVGFGIGVAVSGDDKNEIQTSKKREEISASEVPEDVRRQVEASTSIDARFADSYYNSAYYYLTGSNGYPKNLDKSFELFELAARAGHSASKSALRKYFNYEMN